MANELVFGMVQVLIFNWQLLCILVATLLSYAAMLHQSRRRPGSATPRPILPSILTPKSRAGIPTPRTREKEASVYFQVPDEVEGEHISGESDGDGEVDAQNTALKKASLARRTSSRNARAIAPQDND